MKKIITPILIALAIGTFTACSDSSNSTPIESEIPAPTSNSYIINETENRDVPLDAQVVSVSTQEAQVKLTRDVEAEVVNVYVISGSVEVTEDLVE